MQNINKRGCPLGDDGDQPLGCPSTLFCVILARFATSSNKLPSEPDFLGTHYLNNQLRGF